MADDIQILKFLASFQWKNRIYWYIVQYPTERFDSNVNVCNMKTYILLKINKIQFIFTNFANWVKVLYTRIWSSDYFFAFGFADYSLKEKIKQNSFKLVGGASLLFSHGCVVW